MTLLLILTLALSGCAGVKVSSVSSSDYMSLRRGDVLTTGELSVYTGAALQVLGIHFVSRSISLFLLRNTMKGTVCT